MNQQQPVPGWDDEEEDDTPDVPRSFVDFGKLHPQRIAEKRPPPPSDPPEHEKKPSK